MHNSIKRFVRLMRNFIEIFQSIKTYSVDKFCNVWRISVVVFAPVQEFVMTRFQLMVLVLNHDVTTKLTGHRMHVEGPQIS